MAFERSWPSVAPQAFTSDGTQFGLITVADTAGFKVKQVVTLTSTAPSVLSVQVKRVLSPTQLVVGAVDNKIAQWSPLNISAYTVVLGSSISAEVQPKNRIGMDDIFTAVYDGDPTVALRNVLVDEYGDYYTDTNPLPVNATVTVPPLTVRRLTDKPNDGTPDNLPDAIQVGDGTNRLKVNPDGSINAVTSGSGLIKNLQNIYNSISSVSSGISTSLVTYTVPSGKTAILQRISTSGDNIAKFDVQINASTKETQRTYFGGELNAQFDFTSPDTYGMPLIAGDVVLITVIHNRPSLGSFEGRIQVVEVG